MHSKNNTNEQSFIEQARQKQIIEATIDTLAKYGYVNASFSKIGKHAGIAPSLITYHFNDKETLMRKTLNKLQTERGEYVVHRVEKAKTHTDKLRIAIMADLENMSNHLNEFQAIAEIIFSFRNEKGSLIYAGDTDTHLFSIIKTILENGTKTGEFKSNIDTYNIALIVDAAVNTFLAQLRIRPEFTLETFTTTLINNTLTVIKD